MTGFAYVWWWKTRLPGRRGQRCRIVAVKGDAGRKCESEPGETLQIEFEDGYRTTCSAHAIRKYDPARDRPSAQLELPVKVKS
jgi:hypothetical protein